MNIVKLPDYDDLDLLQTQLWHGYYTLGLINQYRDDIVMVPFRLSRRDQRPQAESDANSLREKIDQALMSGKKVLVVPWEEDYMGEKEDQFTELFNSYQDQQVYFVSEMDTTGQLIFRDYHRLTCKILELPFVLTNDCVCYSKIRLTLDLKSPASSGYNYLCMIGREEKHKWDLADQLNQQGLSTLGYITGNSPPGQLRGFISKNPVYPRYDVEQLETQHRKEAAQVRINGIWASSNVENFLHIESTYDIPLIINPESTMGIFPATEKSIWPALLGKMYLIQAQSGAMRYIQRFHDVNQSSWANLDFDLVYGWDEKTHQERRYRMIHDNRQLIVNSREIYQDLKPFLESARWNFAKNIYNFFRSQIDNL